MALTNKYHKQSNQNDETRGIDSELLEKHCLYYAAILGASLWASWITWMPFLHVSLDQLPLVVLSLHHVT